MPYTASFKKLLGSLSENYKGKSVPIEYQKQYGKRYDKSDIKKFAYAVAKSKNIKIHWVRRFWFMNLQINK